MSKKRILLHGATDYGSSNYGDYLYGEILYDYLKNRGFEVDFYNPSPFFKHHLPEYDSVYHFSKNNSDAIIYVPGGYFGEGHEARFRDNLVQFKRFMPLGIWASFKNLPIAVIGIGAGPNKNFLMNAGIRRIMKKSKLVTARDHESFQALLTLSPFSKDKLVETFDLIIASQLREEKTEKINQLLKQTEGKKILLIHYNHSKEALEKFAIAAKTFINTHSDYHLLVSSDSVLSTEENLYKEFVSIVGEENCTHFLYHSPSEFTALLREVDVVLTCKLHVGVVASTMSKSVIAIACHPEKTVRYYQAIGVPERVASLFDITAEEIEKKLGYFCEQPISLPDDLVQKAKSNMVYLDVFLEEVLHEHK